MDISDGLLQDAAHIARASQVSFALDADCIPTAVDQGDPQWVTCLTGGDDYQLLFTAPAEQHNDIFNLGADHSGLRCIGKVIEASARSEEHTSELQSRPHLVCRLLLEKKKKKKKKQRRQNTNTRHINS